MAMGFAGPGTQDTKGPDQTFKTDSFKTTEGELKITFIGHGTLIFRFKGMVIHVDPFSRMADYSKLPKADLVLITHDHGDHLDPVALKAIRKEKTQILLTKACAEKFNEGTVMANGDTQEFKGIKIEAVPAYNLVHKRKSGEFFHPKGQGNGYVVTFADKRVYVAGDTENTPEMKQLNNIDVAMLPMNLPYTMTEEMVADAAGGFKPGVLYVYHFWPDKADFKKLATLLKDVKGVELRYHMPTKK
jgi:L-ascorbate metabolism protein UlaG (beta-lactamase superfamily)